MECLGRFCAVADSVFLVGIHLGQSFIELRELKEGIVAKALLPAGSSCDNSGKLASKSDEDQIVLADQDARLLR